MGFIVGFIVVAGGSCKGTVGASRLRERKTLIKLESMTPEVWGNFSVWRVK